MREKLTVANVRTAAIFIVVLAGELLRLSLRDTDTS